MLSFAEVMLRHPFPFQMAQIQVDDAVKLAAWGRALADLPVGYGKTCIATAAALMRQPETTVVILPPILIVQWGKWLRGIPNMGAIVEYVGSPEQRAAIPVKGARWLIMSYGIFKNDYARLRHDLKDSVVLSVVDECFPAGTLISTPKGYVDIALLNVGDLVFTSAGIRPILRTFETLALQVIALELSNGKKLECTADHPIFTDIGWLPAKDTRGRWLLSETAVSDLSQGVSEDDLTTYAGNVGSDTDRNHLWKNLHGDSENPERSRLLREDSQQEPWKGGPGEIRCRDTEKAINTRAQKASFRDLEESRCEANTATRQRNRHDSRGSSDVRSPDKPRLSMEPGCELRGEAEKLPNKLQAGLWEQREESRCGIGRKVSQKSRKASSRQEKGRKTSRVRVEGISCSQQKGNSTVYNLHVEGRHDYFAAGVLVHNCHAIKSYKSVLHKKITEFSVGRDLFLMTGTPMSSPADGYAYVKINTPKIYRTFYQFENIHVAERDFFGSVKEWKNLDVLAENLNLRRIHRTKEEVHADLPKANYIPIYYELSKDHKKLYNKLMNDQLLELESGGKIDATTAQNLYHYSQQIIANYGHFADDETKRSNLLDLVDEICDQIDFGRLFDPALNQPAASKFILWTQYKMTSRRLLAYLNTIAKTVGAYSEVDSKKSIASFLDEPSTVGLVAQPGSAGMGLNPQHLCWESLFVELPQRTIAFTQASGRIDRKGQLYNPNIRMAVAKGTVQEGLLHNLLQNDALVNKASGSLKGIKDLIFP